MKTSENITFKINELNSFKSSLNATRTMQINISLVTLSVSLNALNILIW